MTFRIPLFAILVVAVGATAARASCEHDPSLCTDEDRAAMAKAKAKADASAAGTIHELGNLLPGYGDQRAVQRRVKSANAGAAPAGRSAGGLGAAVGEDGAQPFSALGEGQTDHQGEDHAADDGGFTAQPQLNVQQLLHELEERRLATMRKYPEYAQVIGRTFDRLQERIERRVAAGDKIDANLGTLQQIEASFAAYNKLKGYMRGKGINRGSCETDDKCMSLAQAARSATHAIQPKPVHDLYHEAFWDATRGRDNGLGELPGSVRDGHLGDMIRDNPRNPLPHQMAGEAAMREGRPHDALAAFRRAYALNPNDPNILAGMGAAKLALGDVQGGYQDSLAALRLDPNNQAAFANVKLAQDRGAGGGIEGKADGGGQSGAGSDAGKANLQLGRGSDYSALMTAQHPGAADAKRYYGRAMSALAVGDHAAALDAAEKSIQAYANNPGAHLVRARVYADQRAWTKALGSATDGLKLSPKDKNLLRARAMAALRSGDRLAAMEAANALLEVEGGPYSLATLAYARGLNGDRAGMLEALERARDIDPAFQESLDSALQMPADADMLFLFPGESPSERTLEALKKAGKLPGKKGRFGLLALGSLAGGVLIALGLLSSMMGPALTKIRSVFTDRRSPAVTAMRSHDRELLATIEPPSATGHIPGVLRGQYQIKRQIGMGGMGMVFEGEDVSLGRRVAIKKMRDEIRLDRRERQRFVNEAKTVAALHHANIVDIYAIVEENDDVYLVFEYVTGRTVHELIGAKGALSWREAMGIFRGMAAALDFAHQRNIVHRDLKPSNVMIDDEGYVKVMDFGIARAAKDVATRASVMMTNTIVGTPPYMAPEQEQGIVRKESDVYALAICLYEMLTGKMPFVGTGGGMLLNKINMSYVKPSAMVEGLPNGIDEVFVRALQADPDKRYRSARELMAALNDLAPSSRPDTAPPQVKNLPGETA